MTTTTATKTSTQPLTPARKGLRSDAVLWISLFAGGLIALVMFGVMAWDGSASQGTSPGIQSDQPLSP